MLDVKRSCLSAAADGLFWLLVYFTLEFCFVILFLAFFSLSLLYSYRPKLGALTVRDFWLG